MARPSVSCDNKAITNCMDATAQGVAPIAESSSMEHTSTTSLGSYRNWCEVVIDVSRSTSRPIGGRVCASIKTTNGTPDVALHLEGVV